MRFGDEGEVVLRLKDVATVHRWGPLPARLGCLVLWSGLVAACGAHGPPPVARPDWASAARIDGGDSGLYVGEGGPAASEADALSAATARALSRYGQELGVRIESEVRDVQSLDRADALSVRVEARGVPVVIRQPRVVRRLAGPSAGGIMAWVEVAIPAPERARLQRLMLGRTWLTVSCPSDGGLDACPAEVVDAVRAAASEAGLQLLDASATDVVDLATVRERGAAYSLRVTVETRFRGQAGDEHYAEGLGRLEWLEATDEKSLVTHAVAPKKAGAYDRQGAYVAAARAAAGLLASAMKGGAVAFVRPPEQKSLSGRGGGDAPPVDRRDAKERAFDELDESTKEK